MGINNYKNNRKQIPVFRKPAAAEIWKSNPKEPREGDLIYFPLGERLFEIKRVEAEKPFYQLGKTYVYELLCELYEYENEDINTTIEEIDNTVQDEGYITTLTLEPIGTSGIATATLGGVGMIGEIILNDDGYNYTSTPTVTISASPTGNSEDNATAVAITTSVGGVKSIESIRITDPGFGYDGAPTVTVGTAATVGVGTFWRNEVITGSRSGTTARVKRWDRSTTTLEISNVDGSFTPGETITGGKSGASYEIRKTEENTEHDKYKQNEDIETEADEILDFTQSNPFGNY